MEAIIGAVFLDHGYVACQEVITSLWGDKIYTLVQPPVDSKRRYRNGRKDENYLSLNMRLLNGKAPIIRLFYIQVSLKAMIRSQQPGTSRRAAENRQHKLFMIFER